MIDVLINKYNKESINMNLNYYLKNKDIHAKLNYH